ncbi:MAG: GNAT family N-acetyltransferase [Deltaproteobacteria bacterium]|nr:GNAT family N-acetyltransferase [Deltaproteobacteria bacterium]
MKYLVPEELETERLLLRQFQDEDWRELHEMYSDEEATRYTVGHACTEGESWRLMAAIIGHWQLRGYGPYAAVEKASGRVVGPVGFWFPNDWPSPEIKYALARKFWGQGYAREAVLAIQRAGARHLPDIALISLIHRDNLASVKLAQSVGAVLERVEEFRGGQWCVYRHPRVEGCEKAASAES